MEPKYRSVRANVFPIVHSLSLKGPFDCYTVRCPVNINNFAAVDPSWNGLNDPLGLVPHSERQRSNLEKDTVVS